jgi:hypothetical protein
MGSSKGKIVIISFKVALPLIMWEVLGIDPKFSNLLITWATKTESFGDSMSLFALAMPLVDRHLTRFDLLQLSLAWPAVLTGPLSTSPSFCSTFRRSKGELPNRYRWCKELVKVENEKHLTKDCCLVTSVWRSGRSCLLCCWERIVKSKKETAFDLPYSGL